MDDSTVVIAGAARTAMGGMNGALSGMSGVQLGAEAIRARWHATVSPGRRRVIMGCVLPAGLKQAPAPGRSAASQERQLHHHQQVPACRRLCSRTTS
jgi:acetyl-CoA C-acetyltransferase